MIKNKILIVNLIILFISLFAINLVYAESTTVVCCERTNSSAWCQNTQQENCDTDYAITPASCAGTSFCKPGCCFDSQEGLCMENTAKRTCNDANGTWADDAECNIAQCSSGCCIIGDQASFVTLTRCKRLSNLFGLGINFKTDIDNEISCIETAFAQERGACVFESEFEVTCRMASRSECLNAQPGQTIETEENTGFFAGLFGGEEEPSEAAVVSSKPEFYRDALCSDEELGTICGPSEKTMCVDGRNEVYFQDSCGNIANIYDASKIKNKDYWKEIISKDESCNPDSNNADSSSCGNCDYYKGSICGEGSATYGKLACQDLSCEVEINGQTVTKQNGESWCVFDGVHGNAADLVGSRHFRHVCFSGEETIEPCGDYRTEVCIESEARTGGFTEAACRINRWQDCFVQLEEDDCVNKDKRDCAWVKGVQFTHIATGRETTTPEEAADTFSGDNTGGFSGGVTGNVVSPITGFASDDDEEESSGVQLTDEDDEDNGACVPDVPPGLKFWESGDAQTACSLGNSVCIVQFEEGLIGDEECVENCDCLEPAYAQEMNNLCTSLGDCGAYVNIAGRTTYGAAEWRIDEEKQVIEGILGNVRKNSG